MLSDTCVVAMRGTSRCNDLLEHLSPQKAVKHVDRILKGERAGNLPVQSPDKFELAVNLQTARALGLSVRESFLLLRRRGDRIKLQCPLLALSGHIDHGAVKPIAEATSN
jgi:hypothetical protein